MLSAKAVFEEIFDNDEAFQLFCSIAASGEAQGGWEKVGSPRLCPSRAGTWRRRLPGMAPTRTSTDASSGRCCASGA